MNFKIARFCLSLITRHSSLFLRLARRSLGGGWRLHGCQNVWLVAKIFGGYFLDVFKRDGVHGLLELLVIIEAEAVKIGERKMITESIIALIGYLLLADQFLFCAL